MKQELVKMIIEAIEDVSLGIKADETSDILGLGLDSLDYATVMLRVEERVGKRLNEDNIVWSNVRTVSDLADVFCDNNQ